jgi:acyl-CoA thioesterase-1
MIDSDMCRGAQCMGLGRRDCIKRAAAAVLWGFAAAKPAVQAQTAPKVVLIVGDSLSAEYGLERGSGWVALLQKRLGAEKIAATAVNASVSGDTTAGGRSRLPALLARHKPDTVVIELGGNDALRGLPLGSTERNLSEMVDASKAAGAKVLLLGMQLPPNYGRAYSKDFAALYARVAKDRAVALVPFFLARVADGAGAAELFQPDRIHPREAAQPLMLDNVWPVLRPLLK